MQAGSRFTGRIERRSSTFKVRDDLADILDQDHIKPDIFKSKITTARKTMKLEINQEAPHFEVQDLNGDAFSLGNQQGRWLLLTFYRYASCPFCNLRINAMAQNADVFTKLGLDMAAVFQSDHKELMKHAGKKDYPIVIIPDPKQELYDLYETTSSWFGMLWAMTIKMPKMVKTMAAGFMPGKMEGRLNQMPADFLIDPSGKIAIAYYGKDLGDHLSLNRILNQIKEKE